MLQKKQTYRIIHFKIKIVIKTTYIHEFLEQGMRENNEDAISYVNDRCFIVCDGMGGHRHGEIAGKTVAESIKSFFQMLSGTIKKDTLQAALAYAIEELNKKDDTGGDERKMGTTVVLAVFAESSVFVGHAGDSRLYHIRPNEGLLFRTRDHSYVQECIDAGIITEEEARIHPAKNIITRCVQPHSTRPIVLEIDERNNLKTGDYFFLCTDGVTDALTDKEIIRTIANDALADEEKIRYIKNNCAEKSKDNYSGFLLKIEADIVSPNR